MTNIPRKSSLRDLQTIPGVGQKTAEKFWRMDIRSVRDLKGKNPERLYKKLTEKNKRPWTDACSMSSAVPCIMPLRNGISLRF